MSALDVNSRSPPATRCVATPSCGPPKWKVASGAVPAPGAVIPQRVALERASGLPQAHLRPPNGIRDQAGQRSDPKAHEISGRIARLGTSPVQERRDSPDAIDDASVSLTSRRRRTRSADHGPSGWRSSRRLDEPVALQRSDPTRLRKVADHLRHGDGYGPGTHSIGPALLRRTDGGSSGPPEGLGRAPQAERIRASIGQGHAMHPLLNQIRTREWSDSSWHRSSGVGTPASRTSRMRRASFDSRSAALGVRGTRTTSSLPR